MANLRSKALDSVLNRKPVNYHVEPRSSKLFGQKVFGKVSMKEYLSSEAFESVISAINSGTTIDRKVAAQVANSMKEWAISQGATHYTHWFQPLTGLTAEKHDGFFDTTGDGSAIDAFGATQLVQQATTAINAKHVIKENNFLRLTDAGKFLADGIAADLFAEEKN